MVILVNKKMAKSCFVAAICASVKRSARHVSAFSTGRLPNQSLRSISSSSGHIEIDSTFKGTSLFGNDSMKNHYLTTRLMSTAASSTESKVIKRVKTVDATASDETVAIKGWVRTVRKQKTLAFVEVNDGSSLSGIQCVLPFDEIDEASKKGMYVCMFY
jgi:hypothetical protein